MVTGAHNLPDRSLSARPISWIFCLFHSTSPSDWEVSLDTVAWIKQQFYKFVSCSVTVERFLQSIFFSDS